MTYNVWYYNETNSPVPNFGDLLTPKILAHFKIPHRYSSIGLADIFCVGSIIKLITPYSTVLGSGLMHRSDRVETKAKYKFVRGPETRQRIIAAGGKCPEIYGDPGMLLPLFCEQEGKQHEVGIIPHFVDLDYVKQKYPDMHIIDVRKIDPIVTAKEISKCETVISSCLHGIIAAHSFGIPAAWVEFTGKVKGDGVKFEDHYASLNLTPKKSTINDPEFQLGTLDLQPLCDAFESL